MNFQDATMGIVQLRSFGTMTYKIVDPQLFIGKRMKSSAIYKTWISPTGRATHIVQNMIGVLGEVMKSIVDLPALLTKISSACQGPGGRRLCQDGVELEDLRILGISPPPEVQAKINELSGFGLFKRELPQFQQYQMAYAIRDAARTKGDRQGPGWVWAWAWVWVS
jgi:membrane protease subunit (stomatin/prohibitin family)